MFMFIALSLKVNKRERERIHKEHLLFSKYKITLATNFKTMSSEFYLFSHFPKILFYCAVKQQQKNQPKIISSCNQVNKIVLGLAYKLLIGLFFKSAPQRLTKVSCPEKQTLRRRFVCRHLLESVVGLTCGENGRNRIEKRATLKCGAILWGGSRAGKAAQ